MLNVAENFAPEKSPEDQIAEIKRLMEYTVEQIKFKEAEAAATKELAEKIANEPSKVQVQWDVNPVPSPKVYTIQVDARIWGWKTYRVTGHRLEVAIDNHPISPRLVLRLEDGSELILANIDQKNWLVGADYWS